MGNKKGIGLSMNFLVTLIISIVIFTFGVIFVYKLANPDIPPPPEYNPCDSNKNKLCLEKQILEIKPKNLATTQLHILNMLGEEHTFRMEIEKTRWVDPTNIMHEEEFDLKVMPMEFESMIKNNEEGEIVIGIENNEQLQSGTYLISINVYLESGELYDTPIKIFAKVS